LVAGPSLQREGVTTGVAGATGGVAEEKIRKLCGPGSGLIGLVG